MPPSEDRSSYGYGTIPEHATDGERQNGVKDLDKPGFPRQVHRRMVAEVDTSWADLVLILCFFCSGLIDSVAFNTYECFASMQTGNTIFVGLGVIGEPAKMPRYGWTKSLTAIFAFGFGALFFSNYHRFFSPLRRWVLVSSFAMQSVIIGVVAILATTDVIDSAVRPMAGTQETVNWIELVPLALLAFQSAGQVIASRVLKYNELPTVVLTSLIADLMSDAHLTTGLFNDHKRNRRACAVVMLLAGAICGGVFTKGWVGFAGAMWVAAAVKAVMVGAWLLWPPKPAESENRDANETG